MDSMDTGVISEMIKITILIIMILIKEIKILLNQWVIVQKTNVQTTF